MKIQFGILCTFLVALVACEPGHNAEQERQEALNDLEEFRDSVENVVDNNANVNWDEIEREYDRLSNRAEAAYADASEELNTELDNVQTDIDNSIEEWKMESENLNAEADERMDNLENWWNEQADDTGDAMDEAGDDIEESFEETKDWIDRNWDNLKEGTRERWNELKEKMDNDDNDRV